MWFIIIYKSMSRQMSILFSSWMYRHIRRSTNSHLSWLFHWFEQVFFEEKQIKIICILSDHLTCTLCEQSIIDNELKCQFNQCNRTYHSSCLKNSSLTTSPSPDVYYCPLHVCSTCRLHKRSNDNIGRWLSNFKRKFRIQFRFSRSSFYVFILSDGLSWSWMLFTSWFSFDIVFVFTLLFESFAYRT